MLLVTVQDQFPLWCFWVGFSWVGLSVPPQHGAPALSIDADQYTVTCLLGPPLRRPRQDSKFKDDKFRDDKLKDDKFKDWAQ